MTLKTYTHKPRSGNKPTSMVIFLHGLGANGADLISLAQYWDSALPDTVFLSPDAPYPCDMAPYGYQWFSLQNWSPDAILAGVKKVSPILEAYIIEQLNAHDVPPEKLALVGFSQGTMMSLYTGPRMAKRIGGVLGYSGALVGGETLGDLHVHKIPIHLVHGDVDMVVPVGMYQMAKSMLESNGFTVDGEVTRGLSHSIDEHGIESGGAFLKKIFA